MIPTMGSPAMLALQQHVNMRMKQGATPQQIGMELQTSVLPTGAVPVSQLWQLMQYVKQHAATPQAPPNDTVAMQLARQVEQINAAKHPNPMAPQGGSPPAQPPSPVGASGPPAGPPPGGVAGLPAPGLAQPQHMAGGGIVAFDEPDEENNQGLVNPYTKGYGDLANIYGGVANIYSGIPGVYQQAGQSIADALRGQGVQASMMARNNALQQLSPKQLAAQPSPVGNMGPAPPQGMGPQQGDPFQTHMTQGQTPMPAMQQGAPYQPPTAPPPQLNLPSGGGIGGMLSYAQASKMLPPEPHFDPEKEYTLNEVVDQTKAAADKLGIGAAYKAANDYANQLSNRALQDDKVSRGLAMSNAFFKMGEAASRGGATFMGAASEGGAEWAKGLAEARDRRLAMEGKINELKITAAQAADQNNMGVLKESLVGMREYDRLRRQSIIEEANIGIQHEGNITRIIDTAQRGSVMAMISRYDPNIRALEAEIARGDPTGQARVRLGQIENALNPRAGAANATGIMRWSDAYDKQNSMQIMSHQAREGDTPEIQQQKQQWMQDYQAAKMAQLDKLQQSNDMGTGGGGQGMDYNMYLAAQQ